VASAWVVKTAFAVWTAMLAALGLVLLRLQFVLRHLLKESDSA
jgi:hypothetical protein